MPDIWGLDGLPIRLPIIAIAFRTARLQRRARAR